MKRMLGLHILCLILTLLSYTVASSANSPAALHDFTSDGCSLFPNGNREHRDLWCDCCFAHDIAYWQGGTQEERKQADKTLRDCVLERTHNRTLAVLMYEGVRTGGHPAFPTGYRWAYGWSYGRGYQALTEDERQQVKEKLGQFFKKYPTGYCGSRTERKTADERGKQ